VAIRKILVPTDFSPHARKALEFAIELGRCFSAEIHLLNAYFFGDWNRLPEPIGVPESFVAQIRGEAEALLGQDQERVAAAGLSCTLHFSGMDPVAAILELDQSLPADLIVLGTHGFTGMKHVLLGSVAERTVRLAHCPVVTLRAESDGASLRAAEKGSRSARRG
jgi:nucleotide-binding universal stress UspA family protein